MKKMYTSSKNKPIDEQVYKQPDKQTEKPGCKEIPIKKVVLSQNQGYKAYDSIQNISIKRYVIEKQSYTAIAALRSS